MSLGLTTSAFRAEEVAGSATSGLLETIPSRFAMKGVSGGRNVSIPYSWNAAPEGTKSFALTLVDQAPVASKWVHWMVIDIAPSAARLPEGASGTEMMPTGAKELRNSFGSVGYGGPQPPAGTGAHPYVATLYALDTPALDLPADATLEQFSQAIAGHVVASQTCTGRFGR
jgi:Raf kinase inhibitor-like YbhB/YbcL family protein